MRKYEAFQVLTTHPLFEQPTEDRDKKLITEALKVALHALRGDFDEEEFWSEDLSTGDRLVLPCRVVSISETGEVTVGFDIPVQTHRNGTLTIKENKDEND